MKHKTPPNYDEKFASFIQMCNEAKSKNVNIVLVAYPWVIGDTYDEVMESLSRLSKADLALHVASPE